MPEVLAEQVRYYRARAREYDDAGAGVHVEIDRIGKRFQLIPR